MLDEGRPRGAGVGALDEDAEAAREQLAIVCNQEAMCSSSEQERDKEGEH